MGNKEQVFVYFLHKQLTNVRSGRIYRQAWAEDVYTGKWSAISTRRTQTETVERYFEKFKTNRPRGARRCRCELTRSVL